MESDLRRYILRLREAKKAGFRRFSRKLQRRELRHVFGLQRRDLRHAFGLGPDLRRRYPCVTLPIALRNS